MSQHCINFESGVLHEHSLLIAEQVRVVFKIKNKSKNVNTFLLHLLRCLKTLFLAEQQEVKMKKACLELIWNMPMIAVVGNDSVPYEYMACSFSLVIKALNVSTQEVPAF